MYCNQKGGYVQPVEDMRNAYKIVVGKPEGTRTLGRIKPYWWTTLIWMDRIQKHYPVNTVLNLSILTREEENFLTRWAMTSSSRPLLPELS
jgi:hypothetical protein